MMLSAKPLAMTLGAGALAGLLFALPFALGISAVAPLTLTGVPLVAAGLGIGVLAAAGAGLTGIALLTGLLVLLALGPEPIVLFALFFAVPVVFAVQQLQRRHTTSLGYIEWEQPIKVMAWLLAAALLGMVVFGAMVMQGKTDLPVLTRTFLEPAITGMLPEFGHHWTRNLVATLTPVFPGGVIAAWLAMLAVSVAIAVAILQRQGMMTRPAPRMEELRTPLWIPLAMAPAVALALFADLNLAYLGRNAAIALLLPLFLVGAGSFHAIARRTPIPWVILAVFYGFMIVFPPLCAVVALIGVADQSLDLHRRTGLVRSGQEV
jgi:hypothetical protein